MLTVELNILFKMMTVKTGNESNIFSKLFSQTFPRMFLLHFNQQISFTHFVQS